MKKVIIIFWINTLLISITFAQSDAKSKSIFNGKNLKGWHVSRSSHQGTVLNPKIENKAIVLSPSPFGQGGVLLTNKKYKDFELSLEVMIDSFTNGGIFLRSNEGGAAYQIELDLTGGLCNLFGERIPISVPGITDKAKSIWKPNGWNTIKVQMIGTIPRIKVWLDDQLLYDVQQIKNDFIGGDTQGYIGLQCHWTAVYSEAAGKGMPLDSWRPGMVHRFRKIHCKRM